MDGDEDDALALSPPTGVKINLFNLRTLWINLLWNSNFPGLRACMLMLILKKNFRPSKAFKPDVLFQRSWNRQIIAAVRIGEPGPLIEKFDFLLAGGRFIRYAIRIPRGNRPRVMAFFVIFFLASSVALTHFLMRGRTAKNKSCVQY